jgi:hypothetical protein
MSALPHFHPFGAPVAASPFLPGKPSWARIPDELNLKKKTGYPLPYSEVKREAHSSSF